jgi:hypothetical protein
VRTATAGFLLTGVAAAGAIVCALLAVGAAPGHSAQFSSTCDPGDGIGRAHRVKYKFTVNGDNVSDAVLKPGFQLTTDPSGIVDICLIAGGTACRINSSSVVTVLPQPNQLLFIKQSVRHVECEATNDKPVTVRTPQGTIVIGQASRRVADARTVAPSRLYTLTVLPAKTTITTSATAHVLHRQGVVVVNEVSRSSKVRQLWGNGKGAFSTTGRYSSARVRG